MFAITERLVSVTETEAPGIGSLLRFITFPESITAFCAAATVIDPTITVRSNKVFKNSELRIVQFDDAKLLWLRNPYVTSMLTNCIHHVTPMLSTEVVVDK
jgi:hypothetical protein